MMTMMPDNDLISRSALLQAIQQAERDADDKQVAAGLRYAKCLVRLAKTAESEEKQWNKNHTS
jgi:hypothetical protein